jgi:hypothetical protein
VLVLSTYLLRDVVRASLLMRREFSVVSLARPAISQEWHAEARLHSKMDRLRTRVRR